MSICVLRGRSTAAVEPAELTLILLHHAGGSAGSFVPLLPHLPESWRILAPELPARATAPRQPVCPSVTSAVDSFAEELTGRLSGPYAVFGHCLGSLIAFELVHALAARGHHRPMWVGVSGSPAPRLVVPEPADGPPEDWTREQYVAYMRRLGATPEELWNNTLLADRMITALRNDLVVNHGYRYQDRAPLASPLSVMRGDGDPLVTAEEMRPWADHADATEFRSWPGDHFYLFDRAPEVSAGIVGAITAAAARTETTGVR
ncbi:thioesterase II family protein [Streptomyces sp. NPDC096033]|uniref:thioesterase II family protein n=1 Tax=Streptomyces sp. NPDC096033 TaxID=3366071 RepID=UPI0037F522B7